MTQKLVFVYLGLVVNHTSHTSDMSGVRPQG